MSKTIKPLCADSRQKMMARCRIRNLEEIHPRKENRMYTPVPQGKRSKMSSRPLSKVETSFTSKLWRFLEDTGVGIMFRSTFCAVGALGLSYIVNSVCEILYPESFWFSTLINLGSMGIVILTFLVFSLIEFKKYL